MSIQLFIVDWQ